MVGPLKGANRHIVLAGGGHAHIVALRILSETRPRPPVRLTLVTPSPQSLYSGALPGVLAGHWPASAIAIDLEALCDAAGAVFVQDTVSALALDRNTLCLASGKELDFDTLCLDIGSSVRPLNVPDPQASIAPIRPIPSFLHRWQNALEAMQAGAAPASVVIVGAGLAGIEIALAIRHRLRADGLSPAQVLLVETGQAVAAASHPALRRRLISALSGAGITCLTGTHVSSIEEHMVELSGGQRIEAALVVNCAGSHPHGWFPGTGLNTVGGRLEVDECLRSSSRPDIWAVGDAAHFGPQPLPPAGVFAVRAGPVIAANILRQSRGLPLKSFRPQADYLKLVSLGGRRAVAEKYGLALEGRWAWQLKKRIDFSFLRRHSIPVDD